MTKTKKHFVKKTKAPSRPNSRDETDPCDMSLNSLSQKRKNVRSSGYGGRTMMWEGSVEPERQGRRVGGMPKGVARSPGELWPGNWSPMVKKSCFWSSVTYRALKKYFSELNFFFSTLN